MQPGYIRREQVITDLFKGDTNVYLRRCLHTFLRSNLSCSFIALYSEEINLSEYRKDKLTVLADRPIMNNKQLM